MEQWLDLRTGLQGKMRTKPRLAHWLEGAMQIKTQVAN